MISIAEGKYTATIHSQQGLHMVMVGYEGKPVHGIGVKFYKTQSAAKRGATKLLHKAAA